MSKRANLWGIVLSVGLSLSAAAQTATVLEDNYHNLRLHIATATPRTNETIVDGRTYSVLEIDGYQPSPEVGIPCLPTFAGLIEVPFCDGYDIEITDAEYDTLTQLPHWVIPTQPSRSKSDTVRHPLVLDTKRYATDAFIGGTVRVETAGIARDRKLAHIEYCPIQYNPVGNTLIVCRSATITIRYRNTDIAGTEEHFQRYHSPAFTSGGGCINSLYPKSVSHTAPLRYLIVAHSMFRNHLDNFVEWKRRKGYITDIVYTDEPGIGADTTSIAAYIRSQYTGATSDSPAPTYLLLVGDVAQIPPFAGTTSNEHITDLYYTTWTTGDHLPDCYYGRFSAQNVSQLTPQIEKTLMYEQYTFADPSFLDRAVMVAGVDGGSADDYGYTHADPAMDYAITNYINGAHGFSDVRYFKNNTSIVPTGATNIHIDGNSSSMSSTVRNYYNQGAGLINYSAHGSATSWGTPNFTTSHVSSMTNNQKFGIMIGNCCLTNKFETSTCFGESLLRKGNYCGAVGYIGGSNSTYWYEDFYWAVGVRSGIGASMSMAYNSSNLGIYDRLCHTHNEANTQWATSQGSIMMWGNMAVESSTSSRKHYYWEIYHLMGDPSVMPYLTQADVINVTATSLVPYSTTVYNINTEPYAYIAFTDTLTHTVVTAAFADASGHVSLTLPSSLQPGGYEVAVSAQQHRTTFFPVSIMLPEGAFPIVTGVEPQASLNAGSSCPLRLSVANIGDTTAYNLVLTLTASVADALSLSTAAFTLDSLPAGDTTVLTTIGTIGSAVEDGDVVILASTLSWDGSDLTPVHNIPLTINAPRLVADLSNVPRTLQPGESATFTMTITNRGQAAQPASRIALYSPTSLLATSDPSFPLSLAPSASVTHTITVSADSLLPRGINIPTVLRMGQRTAANLAFYIGTEPYETFENNSYHTSGWSQGTYPWQIATDATYTGTYSLRSSSSLSHSQTSAVFLTVDLPMPDTISFYYSVSSEANYDKFYFLIDNNEILVRSGTVGWTRHAALIPAGTHTLQFAYTKDHSVSSGSDCAWIDEVRLPHYGSPVSFRTDEICTGDTYVLGSDSIDTQQPGHGSHVLTSASGVTLVDYTVHPTTDTTLQVQACDSYTYRGTDYTQSDNLFFTLADIHGCDSTITLLLTIHHSASDTVVVDTAAASYMWNGTTYQQSGVYEQHLTTTEGCDSTITLVLTLEGTTGITDIAPDELTVSPNPTSAIVRLSRPVTHAEVYDIQGRLLLQLDATDRIDLASLPAGSYTLRLTTEAGTTTRRVNKSY